MKHRLKDKVCSFGNFDPKKSTLVYVLFVSGPNFNFEDWSEFGLNLVKVDFTYFRLHIFYGYYWIPSMENEYLLHTITSSPRIDKESIGEEWQSKQASMLPDQLGDTLAKMLSPISDQFLSAASVELKGQQIPPEALPLFHTIHCQPPPW